MTNPQDHFDVGAALVIGAFIAANLWSFKVARKIRLRNAAAVSAIAFFVGLWAWLSPGRKQQ